MNSIKTLAVAGAIAATLALAPAGAQAQQAVPAQSGSSFDGYRVLAVTAGVMIGATAAVIVTDGLIIPAYVWATGSGMGAANGAGMAGAGAGVASMAGHGVYHAGYGAFRGGMQLLGAIGGAMYADDWYMGR